MKHQTIAVLDYGSQYSQLICRRIRESQVYAELIPWDRAGDLLPGLQPQGIILSGSPTSVYAPGAPALPEAVLDSGVPVLGICYGLQLLAHTLGGQVAPARTSTAATVSTVGAIRGRCQPAAGRSAAQLPGVDEPRRSRGATARRLHRHRPQHALAPGSHRR